MLCPACGKMNSKRTKFCTECGSDFPADVGENPPQKLGQDTPATATSSGAAGAVPQPVVPCRDALKAGMTQAPWLSSAPGESSPTPSGYSALVVPKVLEKYRGANSSGTMLFPQHQPPARVQLFGKDTLNLGRVPGRMT